MAAACSRAITPAPMIVIRRTASEMVGRVMTLAVLRWRGGTDSMLCVTMEALNAEGRTMYMWMTGELGGIGCGSH